MPGGKGHNPVDTMKNVFGMILEDDTWGEQSVSFHHAEISDEKTRLREFRNLEFQFSSGDHFLDLFLIKLFHLSLYLLKVQSFDLRSESG